MGGRPKRAIGFGAARLSHNDPRPLSSQLPHNVGTRAHRIGQYALVGWLERWDNRNRTRVEDESRLGEYRLETPTCRLRRTLARRRSWVGVDKRRMRWQSWLPMISGRAGRLPVMEATNLAEL